MSMFDGDRLSWTREGRDWPNREHSSFVQAGGLNWHVQRMGEGPTVLLVHGMGAATHSWRDLAPALARQFSVVAVDLPGHGFTSRPPLSRLSLEGMSGDLAALLGTLGTEPALAVGHSAGAAILCRMALDGMIAPRGVISLNGALQGFRGFAGQLFSPLAKLLAWSPMASHFVVATLSGPSMVDRLLADTGSRIDGRGVEFYGRLVASPGHVGAALGMMSEWNLDRLERDLPRLAVPLLLVAGSNDRAVPPASARRVRERVPGARMEEWRGVGHLLHEERPAEAAELIERFAASLGIDLGSGNSACQDDGHG